MRRCKQCAIVNNQGYTLLEALFHIIVFGLAVQLVLLVLLWMQQMNSTFFTNEQVAWELFAQDVQNYFDNAETITLSEDSRSLDVHYASGSMSRINQSGDVLRLRKDHEGNIPLLMGIQKVSFEWHEPFLSIEADFLSGIKKERRFIVQPNQ